MGKKILIVLTSADKIPATGKPTGWYLPELAHPYKELIDAGFTDIDAISPKGGKSPLDTSSIEAFKDDAACQWFQKDAKAQSLVNNTKTPSQITASDYSAVLYPGGHGPMFDLATDQTIAKITAQIYEKGGVVAAVCHGPAGLLLDRSVGIPD
ncbi:plasma membrane heat shock protein [Bulinus truncatus]|nr:plasma membrane heat shock protein [Bulinus truncatus]